MSANGGAGGDGGCFPGNGDDGGGGAGGRIAVRYASDAGFAGFPASRVDGAPGGGHVGDVGSMVFLDTTNDGLRVTQHLDLPADSAPHFGSLIVEHRATLRLGGGSTLTVDGALALTGNSTLIAASKNAGGQVDGAWLGAGVTIAARTLLVEAGSAMSADRQGYGAGGGPGAGGADDTHGGAGGGHGGSGGLAGDDANAGGAPYGDAFVPLALGSGGGATRTAAGAGGGAIAIEVSETLTLDGAITANGNCFSAPGGGGGAGGSILVRTAALSGSGLLQADGGDGGDGGCFPTVADNGGGGAGGRIAVRYASDIGFAGFTTSSVNGAPGGGHFGAPGTLLFLDTTTDSLRVSQHLELPPDTAASFGAVTVDDAATLTIGGGTTLTIERDFVVTGNSTVLALGVHAEAPVDDRWQGTGVAIRAGTARIDAGSAITADASGYLGGLGPGVGGSDGAHDGGGGGHGGAGGGGGDGVNAGGTPYGDAAIPLDLGSGGGATRTFAGAGGGALLLGVRDRLRLDGVISSGGGDGGSVGCSLAGAGGGAGGSIIVLAPIIAGDGGLHADGGWGGVGGCTGSGDDGGGGGGGRIAVYYRVDDAFAGFTTSTANGGSGGRPGAAGTMRFITCGGDCNGDGRVTIDELVRMVNVALGSSAVITCLAGDATFDEHITVEEIVAAVNHALGGCPAAG